MAHAWNATINIDKELAEKLIQKQFGLTVKNIVDFDAGWDNAAYLVNDEFIFRFPKREMAIACMQNEIYVLPYLANLVSFPFSSPLYVGKPSDDYPYAFAGYRFFNGKAMVDFYSDEVNQTAIAEKLASWLKELHQVPVLKEHKEHFANNNDWRLDIKHNIEKHNKNLLQYKNHFQLAGFNVKELQDYFSQLERFNFDHIKNKTYVHGDLYFKHIILNENLELEGLIDWGDVHIGSPGIDLTIGITAFDGLAREKFFETYQNLETELSTVAAFRAFCHQLSFLPYAHEMKDEQGILWAKLALKRSIAVLFDREIKEC